MAGIHIPSDRNLRSSYCLSENELLVEPKKLAEYFEPLANIYEPALNGKPLVELFRVEWAMFDHPKMDNPHAKELLADIFDDGEIVRKG